MPRVDRLISPSFLNVGNDEKEVAMKDEKQHNPRESAPRWPPKDHTPGFEAYHEVALTKDFGPERTEDLLAFINKHIAEFKGKLEEKPGIPQMLFERKQDAHKFANELIARLNIPKEHITVKARK